MRRIFNLFMKEEIGSKVVYQSELTIRFNQWVSQNYEFKAYTNKFMVRKWMEVDLPF